MIALCYDGMNQKAICIYLYFIDKLVKLQPFEECPWLINFVLTPENHFRVLGYVCLSKYFTFVWFKLIKD